MDAELDLIMPVHNEGSTIEKTLREWHQALGHRIKLQMIISEDGSTDDTKEVLREVSKSIPITLDTTDARRGYAGAVVSGMSNSSAPYILVVDSDGQCDPQDFWQFWNKRDDQALLMGWRVDRKDSLSRKLMSRCFLAMHATLFRTDLHDPSCPYVFMRRQTLSQLLPELGTLREGFWWELTARASRAKLSIGELPVSHRPRLDGKSGVYKPTKVPGIALRNGLGLIRIWASKNANSRA